MSEDERDAIVDGYMERLVEQTLPVYARVDGDVYFISETVRFYRILSRVGSESARVPCFGETPKQHKNHPLVKTAQRAVDKFSASVQRVTYGTRLKIC